ncbi:DMT family transporter [Natrialbaceae archaeon AArc-T1-2]|uniref:DMT family transporter n=1 Tax=Natrialbaceae archaeon AArc-T1-2 TaxID=3053904 RepID=UPI00255A921D|nr:DMT family transporter [Natrialbaceae archaeon AArc-T1-2]WIV68559.1 DMT family transporter [Natrialbaceae archaeon AArc-T1-2]
MTGATLEVVALALVPAIFWGLAPIFDKRGMAAGGDAVQASLVVVTVELLLYWAAIAVVYGRSAFAGLTLEVVLVFVFAGVIGTAFGRITIFVGVDRVGASLNSAILSTRPLFATLIALAVLGEPLGPLTAAGIVILVVGLTLLALSKGGDLEGWTLFDLVWPIAAAATFAVANVARRYGMLEAPITALEAVAINETAGLIALVAYVLARDRDVDVLAMPRETYVYFTGSGLLTTVAMVSLMAALGLEAGRIAIVDPLVATAPLFTIVFAAVLLRDLERVTSGVVVGAALIVVGAVLITI